MTLRQYLVIMAAGTALSWVSVGLIVTTVDPSDTQGVVFGMFYASLFLALTGLLSIVGLALRVVVLKKQFLISRQVAVTFRQAVLLSTLVVVSLALQSKALFTWWTAVLVVAALTMLEFFFVSTKVKQER